MDVRVEVRAVVMPDGRNGVLLQLPDSYVVATPDDARLVALMLTQAAGEAEA